jgi:hypothetical protein
MGMLISMRELLKPVLDSVLALKTQLHAALSIPLSDPLAFDESDVAATDAMGPRDARRSIGKSFKCVSDHPGYLTSNGLGSLEIGASHDD